MRTNNENTKGFAIKQFISLQPRTRKEIVKFIACNINGMNKADFDAAYKSNMRGYYSTAFRDWKHFGTLEVIDKKYHVTDACLEENVGLYTMTKTRKIELTKRSKDYFFNLSRELRNENDDLKWQVNHEIAKNNTMFKNDHSFNGKTAEQWFNINEESENQVYNLRKELNELKNAIRLIKNV